jgi:beta-lactamase superfamily II metal-dependent hydrolase
MNALEIDYLAVGDGTRSGDAIALRYGVFENGEWKSQYVMTIDGGNKNTGEQLVKHIKEIYKTSVVNCAILTHPDGDHASGMKVIVESLDVKAILMHRPWRHRKDLSDSVVDGRVTADSLTDTLKEAYRYAHEIEEVAIKRKIEITAPHQGFYFHHGDDVPMLRILAPGKDFYLDLIRQSGKTPEMEAEEIIEKNVEFSEDKKEVDEDMRFETENLTEEHGETSAENDMSLIILLEVAGRRVLFTGDAGTMGLYKAIEYSVKNKIDLTTLDVFHVPHHGSRRNLSKGILKYISAKQAYISCAAKGAPSHPSAIVTNALIRRKMKPYCTQGRGLRYFTSNLGQRQGWGSATEIAFSNKVLINK